ncbi:hypothetical protein Scep_028909 [Stephania cephalantha]|uniref:Cystatin domain-containing protein n=1 Tax=Stephania cephalantha TaxID=152367 RepID=A0AAP0EDY2_9MAGN
MSFAPLGARRSRGSREGKRTHLLLHLPRDEKERASSIDEQRIDSAVGIALFFSPFLSASSDPSFEISSFVPNRLRESNPVPQDPISAIHPPRIYAGDVASAMGFGLCRSKMMNGIVALHSPPMRRIPPKRMEHCFALLDAFGDAFSPSLRSDRSANGLTGGERAKRVVRNGKKDTTTSPLCWTAGANTVVSDQQLLQIRVGGFKPVDPKDPHVVEIARFAVDEHNKQAHTNLVFLEVFGAESQIVKGRNFKLTIRVANGTRRGFRTTHEALVYEGLKGQRTLKYFKAIPWVGGFQPIDPKDAHVIEVARFAVDAYNKQAHTNLGFLIVVEGESQVVAGTNYNLTIRVYNGGLIQTYVVFVYVPLRGQMELKSFKIINGVGNKLGGFKLVDPRDPHIVEIGRYAVDEYNKQAHKSLVFKSVIQAQVQIVNGRNYKVTIRVAEC